MCDELDALTDRAAQEAEFSRRKHTIEAAWKAAQPPTTECQECDAAMPELRQQMRCVRCVDCQEVYERHQRLFFGKRG